MGMKMLSWIPLIGPILQGLFSTASSIYATFKSTQVEQIKADVETSKVAAQIIHDTNDDIGIRIMRDGLCIGPVVWCLLGSWDTIIGARQANGTPWHPDLIPYMFHVGVYPEAMAYLPFAVVAFLLGNIGFNIWKRK